MVGKMTYGKRQWEHLDAEMRRLIPVFHHEVADLVKAIDDDTAAFNDYMAALKLPRGSEEEVAARRAALQAGLRSAVAVPLGLQRRLHRLWEPLDQLAPLGNIATKSDLQVAVRCLETASWGAYHNVSINLKDIEDAEFRERTLQEASDLADQATVRSRRVLEALEQRQQ